jgi:hypothetical protein
MHLYLATDLEPAHPDERLGPDEDEHLRLERRPFGDAVAAVERGEIADAKSIVGLLRVERLRAAGDGRAPFGDADELTVPMRTYRSTAREYASASTDLVRRSRVSLAIGVLFALAAAVAILSSDTVAAIAWVVLALVFGAGLFAYPVALLTAWRYRDRVLQETAVGVGPAGLIYRTATYVGETGWATFRRIRETQRFLFLDIGPQQLYIPVRVFSRAELVEIRRLSAAAGFGPDGRRRPGP